VAERFGRPTNYSVGNKSEDVMVGGRTGKTEATVAKLRSGV